MIEHFGCQLCSQPQEYDLVIFTSLSMILAASADKNNFSCWTIEYFIKDLKELNRGFNAVY